MIRHDAAPLLDIEVERPTPRTLVVRSGAELDTGATAELAAVLERELGDAPPYRLVLDLARVTLLAPDALTLLLHLHRRCRLRDVHLVLVGVAQPAVNRALRISGLLPHFSIRPTVGAAIRGSAPV
jgi:anti-anti-sigma factor